MHADDEAFGPWHPGLASRMPREWLGLATSFRPENVFGDLAAVEELAGLTGLPRIELVAFRPQRLALHELLIRVTADFVVPDGSRIGDLGINFRRIASRILTGYLLPHTDTIEKAYRGGSRRGDGNPRGSPRGTRRRARGSLVGSRADRRMRAALPGRGRRRYAASRCVHWPGCYQAFSRRTAALGGRASSSCDSPAIERSMCSVARRSAGPSSPICGKRR